MEVIVKSSPEAMGRSVVARKEIWLEAQDRWRLNSWVERMLVKLECTQ